MRKVLIEIVAIAVMGAALGGIVGYGLLYTGV